MWREKICIILFAAALAVFSLAGFLTEPKTFSETENRFLEEKPEFTIESLLNGQYTKDYEAFVTDQFVLRDQWIRLKTVAERLFLKQDINGVYFCKDHYLMEKKDAAVFESEQAKKNIEALISMGREKEEKFSPEHMQVVLAPTASQVLYDKLPPFSAPYDQTKVTGPIIKAIGEEYVLDAKDVLLPRKEEYIYYRTDHHWTSLGAYYTYCEWAGRMGFVPFDKKEFDIEMAEDAFYGTLASKVNVSLKPDEIFLWEKKDASYTLAYDMSDDIRHTLYDRDALAKRDKYKVFLGGNYGLVQIDTGLKNNRRLLVIKDSFGNSFVPFACNHFETAYVADLRYLNISIDVFMEEMKITDLLVLYNTVNLCQDKNVWKLN